MQRTRINRRLIFGLILPICLIALLVFIDQITKICFRKLFFNNGKTNFIGEFIHFTYVFNRGAAYGMFADKDWGQLFFKALTVVSIIIFICFFFFAYKKKYYFLTYSLTLMIAGTIGNFIDRLVSDGVIDFICIKIGEYMPFGVFNVADVLLSVGVVCLFVHFLFLDNNALFGKSKDGKEKV